VISTPPHSDDDVKGTVAIEVAECGIRDTAAMHLGVRTQSDVPENLSGPGGEPGQANIPDPGRKRRRAGLCDVMMMPDHDDRRAAGLDRADHDPIDVWVVRAGPSWAKWAGGPELSAATARQGIERQRRRSVRVRGVEER
jgi:hypothetical protein